MNQLNSNSSFTKITTGTTIVAAYYNDRSGVMFVSDRRLSAGMMSVASRGFLKLHRIDDRTIVGFSGSVSTGQTFLFHLKHALKTYRMHNQQDLSPKGLANIASVLVKALVQDYENAISLILASYNPRTQKCEMYSVGADGCVIDEPYNAIGSGFLEAYPYIVSKFDSLKTKDEIKECLIDSVRLSNRMDLGSGEGIDIATLDQSGLTISNIKQLPPFRLGES